MMSPVSCPTPWGQLPFNPRAMRVVSTEDRQQWPLWYPRDCGARAAYLCHAGGFTGAVCDGPFSGHTQTAQVAPQGRLGCGILGGRVRYEMKRYDMIWYDMIWYDGVIRFFFNERNDVTDDNGMFGLILLCLLFWIVEESTNLMWFDYRWVGGMEANWIYGFADGSWFWFELGLASNTLHYAIYACACLTHYNHYMFRAANSVIYSNDFQLLPCFLFGSSKVRFTLLKMMFLFQRWDMFFFSEGIPTKRLVFDKTFISSQAAQCLFYLPTNFTSKSTNFFRCLYYSWWIHGCYGSHKSVA